MSTNKIKKQTDSDIVCIVPLKKTFHKKRKKNIFFWKFILRDYVSMEYVSQHYLANFFSRMTKQFLFKPEENKIIFSEFCLHHQYLNLTHLHKTSKQASNQPFIKESKKTYWIKLCAFAEGKKPGEFYFSFVSEKGVIRWSQIKKGAKQLTRTFVCLDSKTN